MKLTVLHDGSLKPRKGSSLNRNTFGMKPDIIDIAHAVPQLHPVGEEDLAQAQQANDMANQMSAHDVTNIEKIAPGVSR